MDAKNKMSKNCAITSPNGRGLKQKSKLRKDDRENVCVLCLKAMHAQAYGFSWAVKYTFETNS